MSVPSAATPPTPISPRFTLELEFVLSLSNPFYLQHLAATYPHLLNPPPTPPTSTSRATSTSTTAGAPADNSDAACFARYLAYLYAYWRTPQYSQYLTHPGAVLRNLELLQQDSFRRDMIRPDVIARLFETGEESGGAEVVTAAEAEAESAAVVEGQRMDTSAG